MTPVRWFGFAIVALLVFASMPWWMPPGPRIAASGEAWDASEEPSVQGSAAISALEFERDERLSATAWFNQGVAWQGLGDHPRAIAAYRAASRLSPRSPDIVHNLATARAELDENPPPPVSTTPGWTAIITPGELGFLSMLLWLGTSVLLAQTRKGQMHASAGAAALIGAVLTSALTWEGRRALLDESVAVVLDEAVVRDGAAIDAGQRHVLPPGTEIRVERVRGEFALVEDGKQRRGWVLREALEAPRL